jgi:hypothetical protein
VTWHERTLHSRWGGNPFTARDRHFSNCNTILRHGYMRRAALLLIALTAAVWLVIPLIVSLHY